MSKVIKSIELNIALLGSGKPALVTPPLIVTGGNATAGGVT